MRTILKIAVFFMVINLVNSYAQTCQGWENDVEYAYESTIIYEGEGYIANRLVYQNTPPRPEDNEWFWSPHDCGSTPPSDGFWKEVGTGEYKDIVNTNNATVGIGFVGGNIPTGDAELEVYCGGDKSGIKVFGDAGTEFKIDEHGMYIGTATSFTTIGGVQTWKVVCDWLSTDKVMIKDWTIEAPDYVFNKDYKLRSLKDVEKYITENNHLPEVPSAESMKKEGVDLSELNMTLLKKIEELTLYTIQQQKEIEMLKKEIGVK